MTDISKIAEGLTGEVCHEEQLEIWVSEFVEPLVEFLRSDWSYEDTIDLSSCLKLEIKRVVEKAFQHPAVREHLLKEGGE